MAGAVVSFECVLVLFLFAGQYKADPRFEWLPLDATVLFGLINVVQGAVLLCDRRFKPNSIGIPMTIAGATFAAYVLASTLWADGVYYAQYKAAYISTINTWCLFAGALVVSSSTQRLLRFLVILLLFSGWIGIECLLFYAHHSQFGRVMQLHAMGGEAAYIGLSRVVALGAVVCAVLWMFHQSADWPLWRSKAISFVAMGAYATTVAMIGARGPIAAAVLALLGVAVLYSSTSSRQWLSHNLGRLVLVGALCVGAIAYVKFRTGEYPLLVQRCLAFSSNSEFFDASGDSTMRLELFAEAFYGWLERPIFGHGIGGFSLVWANIDERLFPHNLFLELLCELGVVGLALFILIPAIALQGDRSGWKRTPPFYQAMVMALAGSAFLNTMTSGDLPDNRLLFFTMGLLAFRAAPNPLIGVTPSRHAGAIDNKARHQRLRRGPRPRVSTVSREAV